MHLIPLRAVSKGNLKVELQPGTPVRRVGVHASACRGQEESS